MGNPLAQARLEAIKIQKQVFDEPKKKRNIAEEIRRLENDEPKTDEQTVLTEPTSSDVFWEALNNLARKDENEF